MRIFLSVLILIFSLQSWAKTDDITDFEIEGISIGDSLLNYFSKDEIELKRLADYKDKEFSRVDLVLKNSEKFENLQFHFKTSDSNYKIHMISAGIFLDDMSECIKQMKEIDKDLMENFSDINREEKPVREHPEDPGSKINQIYYYFSTGGGYRTSCFDFSDKSEWDDHIKVTGFTEEILNWFINKAY